VPRSIDCSVSGYRVRDGVADRLWMTTGRRFIESLESHRGRGSISIEQMSTDALGAHDGALTTNPRRSHRCQRPSAADEPPTSPAAAGDSLIPTVEPGLWELWSRSWSTAPGSGADTPPICQGGFASVLDITGDPDTVMAEYVEQIRAWSAE
jgi:hypothetical protein